MEFNIIWVSVKNGAFNVTRKKPVFVFDDSVCFLLNRILSIDFLNNSIGFVNNFELIKYYSETVILANFLFRILVFEISDMLSMFHGILLFQPKYKSLRIPNGLKRLMQ